VKIRWTEDRVLLSAAFTSFIVGMVLALGVFFVLSSLGPSCTTCEKKLDGCEKKIEKCEKKIEKCEKKKEKRRK